MRDCFANQRRLSFLVALAILLPSASCLFASGDFDRPNTYIGNADWDGGLILWVEIAQVPIGGGITLPLRMRFTSKTQEALFGGHWWCPLLESRAIFPKSYYVEYSNLGGGGGYLARKNQFNSDNGKIRASVEGNAVEMTSSGWVYRFSDGKMREATSPSGTSLVWTYGENGECTGVETKDGKSVLAVTRTTSEWKISIPSLEKAFLLKQTNDAAGAFLGWVMTFPDGRKEKISLVNGADGVTQMSMSDGALYRWRTESGALISDSDFTYEMRPTDIGRDLLNRVDSHGLTEWYYYDSDKGAASYKRQDGSRVVSWYDLKPGPSNMQPFRMDTISEDQKLVSSRLLSYTPEGEVEKEWTEEGTPGSNSSGAIRFIRLDEAMNLHAQPGTLFIDARHPVAFQAGSIPGSLNLARTNFERDYAGKEALLKSAKMLVVYCTSRNCEDSSIVATKLAGLGYKNVVVFDGGWAEWWKHH